MKFLEKLQELLYFECVRIKIKNFTDFDGSRVIYKHPVGFKNFFPLISLSSGFFILIYSLFTDEIQTFQEYSETIYNMATIFLNISVFILTFRERARIFRFIDMFENEIEKRKLMLYVQTDGFFSRD